MKTLEDVDKLELLAASYACDYRDSPSKTNGVPDSYLVYSVAYDAFFAGYKAAKDSLLAQFKSLLSSYAETSFNPSHTAWQIFDALQEGQAAKDQVADVSKVMPKEEE